MIIAVLSDTHLRVGQTLPAFVWQHLTNVNMILHAGDLINIGLLEELTYVAPVYAVRGNCDDWDVPLPNRKIIECAGLKIGLIHGDSGKERTTQERAYAAFKDSAFPYRGMVIF